MCSSCLVWVTRECIMSMKVLTNIEVTWCVCVWACVFVWNHLLSGPIASLSSHVYLKRHSSEIKGQKQRVVCSFISSPSHGGWQFLQLTPPGAIIALSVCVARLWRVCVCVLCVCVFFHLGPPALPDLSGSDILPAPHYEQSISSSHTAVSRKDFNIVLLFLESFVLFRLIIYGGNWGGGLIYS